MPINNTVNEDERIIYSLSISGAVEGDGKIKVFAEDVQGNRFLVADYQYEKKSGLSGLLTTFISDVSNSLTGAVIDSGSSDSRRYLDSECVETCDFKGEFKGNKLKLFVEVEPGTTLNLYKIDYYSYSREQDLQPKKSILSKLWDKIFG